SLNTVVPRSGIFYFRSILNFSKHLFVRTVLYIGYANIKQTLMHSLKTAIMQTIDLKLLKELVDVQDTPCISIYMPTHRVHPANATDPITFKNLYKQALQYIQDNDLQKHTKLIQPLEKLINANTVCAQTDEGVASFVAPDSTEIIRLPEKVQVITCVADSFCVTPLFKLYHANQQSNLVALAVD